MATSSVIRPGHISLRVLDVAASIVHYRDRLGLHETDRDAQGRVYFKGWDEQDWFSVVLREGDRPGMDYCGFKVMNDAALESLEADLKAFGCKTERIPAGELKRCGERVRFVIPTGHSIELYAQKEYMGNGLGRVNPDPWPEGLKGMQAQRYDHCLLYGDDLDGTIKLFTEVLKFDLTEQVVDGDLKLAAFLACSNKAHDIAFIRHAEKNKFHHASFLLGTWEEVLRAADLISMHDISLDLGPTRHGITRGRTIYFFDPSGNRNEGSAGITPGIPITSRSPGPRTNWGARFSITTAS